jgi:hypothetical protein
MKAKLVLMVLGALFLLMSLLLFAEKHRMVTRRMGWECTGTSDTGNAKYLHIESAKFWFRDNPHFEERASGPSVCADLKAAGRPDVEMTFDTWGNSLQGLHGYDSVGLTAGGKTITLYESDSGGFHDDEPHFGNFSSSEDMKLHPDKYRSPVDTFRR